MDPTKTLRIVAQNTQNSLQITNDSSEMMQTIMHLKEIEAYMFIGISLNINSGNPSNIVRLKQQFQRRYQQVRVLAISSNIGAQP